MKIDSKLRYIYTLELTPKEYRLLCEGMSELEAATSLGNADYAAIAKMEAQLGENVRTDENAQRGR